MAGEQLFYNRPLPGARLNMAHPLAKGMVGCWLLNENGGMRAMDLSPYGNHGTLTGFADPPPRPFNGMLFDGVNDYIECPTISISSAFTLLTWAKPTTEADYEIISKSDELILRYAQGKVTGFVYSGAWNGDDSPSFVGLNNWNQMGMTWDGGNVEAFANGQTSKTPTASGAITATTNVINIGKTYFAASFLGSIGLVSFYRRVLSAEDIKVLYISPYHPIGLPLFL